MFRHTFVSLAFTTLCLAAGQAGAEPAGLLPALPYVGQPGQQPSRVALAWLAPVLGEGITPASRQLLLDARSAEGEDPRQVTITVTQSGLLDDSLRDVRYQLVLSRQADHWQIDSSLRQHRCRRPADRLWRTTPCA